MTGRQHLTFGLVTGAAFTAYLYSIGAVQTREAMFFVVGGSVLGSLLPDIDSREATISKMLPPVTTLLSKLINNLFGHRGLIHYPIFWMIHLGFTLPQNFNLIGLYFGVFGHLLLDACTYKGIPGLTWAFNKKSTFRIFPKKWKMYVGTIRASVANFLMTVGTTTLLLYLASRV